MQAQKKPATLIALLLLSACSHSPSDPCKDKTLCSYAIQDSDTIYLFVANRTNRSVVIPRILGLDTPEARFLLEPVEKPTEAMQCEVRMATTIWSEPEPFPLDEYQVAGMAVGAAAIRDVYCLPKGCRDFVVSFEILPAGKAITSGPLKFEPHRVKLCL